VPPLVYSASFGMALWRRMPSTTTSSTSGSCARRWRRVFESMPRALSTWVRLSSAAAGVQVQAAALGQRVGAALRHVLHLVRGGMGAPAARLHAWRVALPAHDDAAFQAGLGQRRQAGEAQQQGGEGGKAHGGLLRTEQSRKEKGPHGFGGPRACKRERRYQAATTLAISRHLFE
jgi:hypothetical protein